MEIKTTVAAALVAVSAGTCAAADAAKQLNQLFEERYAWEMREYPEIAMSRGDYTRAAHITINTIDTVERRHVETAAHLDRLARIKKRDLSDGDRLNHTLFERLLREEVEAHRFRMFLAPVGPRSGPHQRIAQMGERVRFVGAMDYENYLRRLDLAAKSLGHATALLRMGLAEGRTPPRVTLSGLTGQIDALLDGGLDALAKPFTQMPDSISQERADALQRRFGREARPGIERALREFGVFLRDEYIPGCRQGIAAKGLPDGEEYYAFRLRAHTTTRMTAREVHELGLSEVSRIRGEMLAVIRSSDFMERCGVADELSEAQLFRAFIHYLRTDSRFYHDSAEDLLREYRDICKRVDGWLPKLFGILPRLPYGVKEIPAFMAPNQTTAYYQQGDIRNSEAGFFYANTYALDQRPKYEMVSLAMHEAVPGHHLQVALMHEIEGVPEFRRNSWVTAYGEGWALYSERLGIEMGLYDDPYDDFGRLLYEMWRACRLVVDPGMHALGWSRDRAIDFMLEHTALSELNIRNEIDRYISWPGQATAYKIGELKIRALRREAEERLRERFDIRAFHDVVLGAGSIPLTVLDERVRAWLAAFD